jgi:DNA-directed RNA polymerase subunit RPC12/RpoP
MSEFSASEMAEAEKPLAEAPIEAVSEADKKEFEDATQVYVCNSCGAAVIADENTAASECYYCHNPVTLAGRVSGEFRPDRILPFKVPRDVADAHFRDFIKKKWFVPNSFKSEKQLEKVVGLYTPFWLADCKTNANISAEAKIINSHTSGNVTITHTKVYECDRAGYMTFEKIPADGSKKLDDDFLDSVEPFDYDDMVDFNMSYLSGFFADKYDVPKSEIIDRIRQRAGSAANEVLKDDINGYSSVSVTHSNINLIRTDWQYVLLPLWFMTYSYKDKIYQFAVNGQTGKVAGLPPLSIPKMLAMIAAIVCGLNIIGWFAATNMY